MNLNSAKSFIKSHWQNQLEVTRPKVSLVGGGDCDGGAVIDLNDRETSQQC